MDLRYAREGDGVRRLWADCFEGDTGETFFETEYDPGRCLVQVTDEGRVVSMLHWVYRTLSLWGEEIQTAYILGVATHPLYRRRGLARELIEQVLFELHLRKVPMAFLKPESAELVNYYKAFGFRPVGLRQKRREKERSGRPAGKSDIPFLSVQYRQMVAGRPHIMRTDGEWEIILREYDVFINEEGYSVFDGRYCLETNGAGFENNLAGSFRIIEARKFLEMAAQKGKMTPRTAFDEWCPWNDMGGNETGVALEEFYFIRERIYSELLYNGGEY